MNKSIRWGILATGAIAEAFTRDLQLLPDAEVVAVGSRSEESARAFAERFDIPRVHGSWASLAADEEVDIVYVATPHHAHYEAARLCLEAGRAVLCEKPFTLNAADSRALTELAAERGRFLMEAMWMRCNPAVLRVAELIAAGAIGTVGTLQADFGLAGPFAPSHRLRDPGLGGGALLDLGIYPVTLAHLLLGVPDSIQAWASLTPEGVDANTALILGYDSGAVATLTCGIVSGTPFRAYVSGSLGRIELPSPFFRPGDFLLYRGQGDDVEPELVQVPYSGSGYVHEAEEAMRCLRAGLLESPLVPWSSTLEVMRTLDTARARTGVRYPGE
ncbi:Gfo/Idh/MocA family oxidoreductase [Streptacidiphilus sp. PB12-B1b]|uniref:Gfo/Idh/MocA family protein n=1 Tax=Streptacidiphilus sp. PB12-B1b TaxID=2705012 RepID=UPI0015FD938F|nr:Gfo/Idh/MocA family oxidoreductase [Streptacidiphilus sp. PB12-B1b]QMU76238.1 Gfo/Idh/MocA family oxidoreductase [Streptacidiphilus sp. PB12-B1b]